MSRIDSDKVNLGSSYVLTTSDEQLRAQEAAKKKNLALDIIGKAKLQAQQIIAEAQQAAQKKGEELLAEVNSQVGEITEKARQEGYQKGYEQGQAAARQDLIDLIENVDRFAKSEFEIKKRIVKSAHNDIVNLVIAISDKICQKQLKMNRQILYNITMAAINLLSDKEQVKIFVNPNMAKKIYAISDKLKDDIFSLQSIKIVEDSSVSEDGTIVESISSRVDCRISSQIDEITQKLLVELQSIDEERLVSEIRRENPPK
ncbi:hypothetical protein IJE86_09015 [bacterium]|nr:hypothetical protein [bacterium]